MSMNESISSINVKEQIRLKNEEIKRKEEAQYRLVAKSIQKNESGSGPSLTNLYGSFNNSHSISIGGHYSSLKTKKEDGSHYVPNVGGGQKKHNSLYSLSSDNISSNINSNPNVLVLNSRDLSSRVNLSEGNEFSLTLNEAITDSETDKTKLVHLSEYFKTEYNDALRDALRTINMERKFEQRRRKIQDERWETLKKEGRGISATEHELQLKDREKIDIMSKNREIEVTNCVNKNFENKLTFEADCKDNMNELLKRWKGKLWGDLIEFLEKGSNNEEESSEEEEEEEEEEESNEESSNNDESEIESSSDKEESEEHGEESEGHEEESEKFDVELKETKAESTGNIGVNRGSQKLTSDVDLCQTPQALSVDVLNNEGEEERKSELKIEQKLKKSLQSLKPNIEEDSDIQNKCQSMNSIVNEPEPIDNQEDSNVVEDIEKSIQYMLQCNEELQTELKQNIEARKSSKQEVVEENLEKIEVIDVSNGSNLDNQSSNNEVSKSKDDVYDSCKEQYNSKGSLTQINTTIIQEPKKVVNSDSKSFIDMPIEDASKIESDTTSPSDEKLKSAPPVLEDDKGEKLLSPHTADSLKSVNPIHRSLKNLKTEVPYILKHQDKKSLTYDFISNGKQKISSMCRSKVASEVIQMLDDYKLMRASEATPLVAEPGVSILKRIMKKLKKNKPNDNKFEGEVEYQTIDLFGSHLDILYDIYNDIPSFLKACKKYIKAKGIKKQGIFRISGKSGDIKDLKNKFQHEFDFKNIKLQLEIASKIKDEKLRKERIERIKEEKRRLQHESPVDLFEICPTESSVASVFKLFFRELMEPLFTFRMYKLWILLDDIHDKVLKIKLASHLILLLPYTHRLMLHYLLKFLSLVASYSDFNDMTSANLGRVFGPNILRTEEKKKDKPSVELHEKANNVTEFFIDNYKEIFENGSEQIVKIEAYIKELYDNEEEPNGLVKNNNSKSKSHFSMTKTSKTQTKSNRNSNVSTQQVEENKKSPLTQEEK